MKKIKYVVFLIVTFLLLFMVSCNKESINYEEILQQALDGITFEDNVYQDLDFINQVNVKDYVVSLAYLSDNTNSLSNAGKVSRSLSDKCCNLTITASMEETPFKKDKTIHLTVVKKDKEQITILDIKENEENYSNFENDMQTFFKSLTDSNDISFSIKIDMDDYSDYSIIKTKNNPIYIECYNQSSNTRTITQEEDGKIYNYNEVVGSNQVEKSYLCDKENYSCDALINQESLTSLFTLQSNQDNFKITKTTSGYQIDIYYRDLLSDEDEESGESAIQFDEDILNQLLDSVIKIKFIFQENSITIQYSYHFDYEEFGEETFVDFKIEYIIDKTPILPIEYENYEIITKD